MRLVFDRGTVLILDPPKDLDLTGVRGLLSDPRVKAYRAPAHRYVEVLKARRFADRERKDALQVLDPPLPLLLLVRPGQPAKPWQDVDRGRVLPAGERGFGARRTLSGSRISNS